MAFQVSPGVNTSEIDLTTIVPAVATSLGGIAGNYEWGPAKQVILVDSPKSYRAIFGNPRNWNYAQWFSGFNYLSYTNSLQVVRVVDETNGKNAVGCFTGDGQTVPSTQLFQNESLFNNDYNGVFARYPGQKGSSLKVAIFPGPGGTAINETAYYNAGFTAWTEGTVEYYANFGYGNEGAPDHTTNIQTLAASLTTNDQIHVLVVDQDGLFTGAQNTILERFSNLSVYPEARLENGETIFYKRHINEKSQYIYIGGEDNPSDPANDFYTQTGLSFTDSGTYGYVANWGSTGPNGTRVRANGGVSFPLAGGAGQTSSNLVSTTVPSDDPYGYNLFEDTESYDVNLLISGAVVDSSSVGAIKAIAEYRKDCVAFFSPENKSDIETEQTKLDRCLTFKSTLGSSSYCVIDSGYKYQYDPYNDLYRWIPLNADVAGVCARTDSTNDPWWSPAGFNRGQIRNVIKLAFNPSKAFRDQLYPDGINPVITTPGEGTILFGDRTALSKPSAFDRINVRRLFIVLEKAIATASKFSLFEFNDSFTRSQFVSLVTPYLQDVKARRGVIDFKVVCDESNNTAERIDRNEFWADIYIKPNRSINFIQLNFVATRSDSSFTELGA
jgi:hypothetical protein